MSASHPCELWGAAARPVLGNPEVEDFRAFALSASSPERRGEPRFFVRISSRDAAEAASAFDSLSLDSLLLCRASAASPAPASPILPRERLRSVAFVGPMASGKSTVGPLLARLMGLSFVDSDAAVESAAGASVPDIFASEGEAGFRLRETAALSGLLERGGSVIATGGGAVVAPENRALLRSGAVVVWLHARPEALGLRIAPGTRPLLEGADPVGRLASIYRERRAFYAEVADFLVPTEGRNPQEIAEVIHEEILRAR
jgi:shikimate kinase